MDYSLDAEVLRRYLASDLEATDASPLHSQKPGTLLYASGVQPGAKQLYVFSFPDVKYIRKVAVPQQPFGLCTDTRGRRICNDGDPSQRFERRLRIRARWNSANHDARRSRTRLGLRRRPRNRKPCRDEL